MPPKLLLQLLSLPAWVQVRPTTAFCTVGVSDVILMISSPDFDAENGCVSAPPTAIVPANGVSWLFEGELMPPQLAIPNPATTSANAVKRRMTGILHEETRGEPRGK